MGHAQPSGWFLWLHDVGNSLSGRPDGCLTYRPPWQSLNQLRIDMRVVNTCRGAHTGLGNPLFLILSLTPAHCRRHCHRTHTSPPYSWMEPHCSAAQSRTRGIGRTRVTDGGTRTRFLTHWMATMAVQAKRPAGRSTAGHVPTIQCRASNPAQSRTMSTLASMSL